MGKLPITQENIDRVVNRIVEVFKYDENKTRRLIDGILKDAMVDSKSDVYIAGSAIWIGLESGQRDVYCIKKNRKGHLAAIRQMYSNPWFNDIIPATPMWKDAVIIIK